MVSTACPYIPMDGLGFPFFSGNVSPTGYHDGMFAWTKHSHKRSAERGITRNHIEEVLANPQALKGVADEEKFYISAPVVIGAHRKWVTLIHDHAKPPALVTIFLGSIPLKRRKTAHKKMISIADLEKLGS